MRCSAAGGCRGGFSAVGVLSGVGARMLLLPMKAGGSLLIFHRKVAFRVCDSVILVFFYDDVCLYCLFLQVTLHSHRGELLFFLCLARYVSASTQLLCRHQHALLLLYLVVFVFHCWWHLQHDSIPVSFSQGDLSLVTSTPTRRDV